ncbi:Glycoside Hydrolase Family 27 protein [Glomus cerebriforme]|uniref:Alpha-galactosidase n=1 Tax=Glomus cerebriforme TaxID=658196 RepID=A0A397SZG7_9GLOM|nr:Glycoside Hydrolase Family 27 protein [Glomus cerebriforme]
MNSMFTTLFCLICVIIGVNGLNNGLGRTPPMGWNSWNKFNCTINENLIKQIADAFIEYGLKDIGYKYLNIDDCWEGERDEQGYIHASNTTFPSGIKALADYAHSKGLLFGIYSDAGFLTCAGRIGSLGFEDQDAMTYASWGVDYLKYDNCNNGSIPEQGRYEIMRDSLNATGRPIFYSICEWGTSQPYLWADSVGNSWRTTGDIALGWSSIIDILQQHHKITQYAGPGGWNDPDMLQVGNGNLTIDEQKSHFSLWAALKSPLLLGFDIRNPPADTLEIVKNTEIIAINQDSLGKSVNIVQSTKYFDIWTGELSDGHVALLFNKAESTTTIKLNFTTHLNIQGEISIRDLWEHEDKGVYNDSYSRDVPKHGIAVLKLTGGTKISEFYDFIDQYNSYALREFLINYSVFMLIFIIVIFQYYIRYFCK